MRYNTDREQNRRLRALAVMAIRLAAIEAAKAKARKPVRGPDGRFVKRAA